jgi:hypothetical protein
MRILAIAIITTVLTGKALAEYDPGNPAFRAGGPAEPYGGRFGRTKKGK